MLKDLQLSKDIQTDYSKSLINNELHGIEFSVEILTNGTWVMSEFPEFLIPK